jgi:cellulose synthase (UDP-forming)
MMDLYSLLRKRRDPAAPASGPSCPVETLEPARQFIVGAFIVLGLWYLGWRASTINPDAPVFSVAIYAAEIVSFTMALLHVFMCSRLTVREAPPPPPGLTVDIFVPTYNESVDLVRKTLLAAAEVDYPHQTWLLDDGNRPEMRKLSAELGCGYIAREDNVHAKAGNLNNALARTSGEFIAIFDADHAPRRDFLTKTLGYFSNAKLAFVQTPQEFYNLNSYQHRRRPGEMAVWTEQSLFFRVIQRGKDFWNAAFFCGSCAVMRRSVLEEIGGFATGTITEDLHTSIRVHAAGYESVYHAEPLAFGVAPETLAPFIAQRVRWGQGAMHVWRKEGILSRRGLTLAQRLNYFASVSTYFDGWIKLIFYSAPVIVLTTGTLPLITGTEQFLLHFLPYYLLSFWAFEEVGRGYGRSLFIEQYNMIRFWAFARSTLAIVFPQLKFRVTPKGALARREGGITLPQWCVMVANLAAIPVGVALYSFWKALPVEALVANTLWACVNAGLAAAVLRFTIRLGGNRRAAYRFPVPIVATLAFDDGFLCVGTVDDISENGVRFNGNLPPEVEPGRRFRATLELPDGPWSVEGEVRGLIPLYKESGIAKAIGCRIEPAPGELRRLENFLYGSDLQWRVNGLTDQIRTPLNILMPHRVPGPAKRTAAARRWSAVSLSRVDGAAPEPFNGLLSLPDASGERFLMTHVPLAADTSGRVNFFARTRGPAIEARVELDKQVEVANGNLYIWRVHMETPDRATQQRDEQRSTAQEHRTWERLGAAG